MDWIIGIIVNGVGCLIIGALISYSSSLAVKLFAFIICPFLTAFSLYWGMAFIEGISHEHANWAGVFITPWTIVGYLTFAVGLGLYPVIKSRR